MSLPVRRTASPAPIADRWDPFRELDDLHTRMEQLMQGVWSGTHGRDGDGNGAAAIWVPDVDIEETEDAWIVEAELPGVKREDVDIEVRGNELIVSGEIKERERVGILRRRTRRVGEFEYRVTLPSEVSSDEVDASLKDGVLTLRIPKPEQTRPRRIEVQSG
jgi:HSP20 family protein